MKLNDVLPAKPVNHRVTRVSRCSSAGGPGETMLTAGIVCLTLDLLKVLLMLSYQTVGSSRSFWDQNSTLQFSHVNLCQV